MARRRTRIGIASVAVAVVLGPLGWMWAGSAVPPSYSVMGMGYADFGGGPAVAGHDHGDHQWVGPPRRPGDVSVADLTGPKRGRPDVAVTLVARQGPFRLRSGQRLSGFTLNGRSPGPALEATQGDLVQVRLVNADVSGGVTLHWHGLDVPNAEDGVAGVTQDSVRPGHAFTYRFVVGDAGTYWYHAHQDANEQVTGGLFGTFVVHPAHRPQPGVDVVAAVHGYDGLRTVAGRTGVTQVAARPGQHVRVRVVDTDNGTVPVWSATPYRVLAVDGHDVHEPALVSGRAVDVAAGGRADLGFTVPADGSAVRVDFGGGTALVIGPRGARVRTVPQPERAVDLLSYGTPAPLGFDAAAPDRRFAYIVDRRPGFLGGVPGVWWSVNGRLFPDVPMFVVREGDVVRMTITNDSGEVHPMHLHGHHAVVLSRDGVRATGSPWWFDSLTVDPGETYVVAFVADNPGIWMDHCHNLKHVSQGMNAHLAYAGVWEPYRIGGPAANDPE